MELSGSDGFADDGMSSPGFDTTAGLFPFGFSPYPDLVGAEAPDQQQRGISYLGEGD